MSKLSDTDWTERGV